MPAHTQINLIWASRPLAWAGQFSWIEILSQPNPYVRVRIKQYEALNNGKGIEIAKQIIFGKLKGPNELLRKYGLRQHDLYTVKTKLDEIGKHNDLNTVRRKLLALEGHCTDRYYQQIFQLLPETLRIDKRKTRFAYDGINNLLNLTYTMLK